MKKEKFMGAHPDLQGFVFEAGSTRTNQIAKFTTVDTCMRALIGQQFDPMVLESIEKMTVTVPPEPNIVTESDGSVSKMEEIKYGKKYDRWLTRTERIEKEMKQVYSIYYGQCDEDIKASLAEHAQFEVANQEKNVIQLYKILQSVNFSYRSNQEPILTMWNAKADFIKLRQQKQQTVQEYYERFIAMRDVNETLGNNIHDDLGFVEVIAKKNGEDPSTLADNKKTEYIEQGRERMMAIHMLMGADRDRFGSAIEDFEHAYLMDNRNRYPKTLHDCFTLLKSWKKAGLRQNNPLRVGVSFNTVGGDDGDGAAFVNSGSRKYSGPPCTRCGRDNHSTDKCFARKHTNGTLLHMEGGAHGNNDVGDEVSQAANHACVHDVHELMFVQPNTNLSRTRPKSSFKGGIPDTWILIDSQSTIDVFSNGKLLVKIKTIGTTMNIRCNAGMKSTNMMGYLSGYGWVWYFPDGIANILSLSRVKDKYRVTFDSAMDNCFHVHKPGRILKFREASRRLYSLTHRTEKKIPRCSSQL